MSHTYLYLIFRLYLRNKSWKPECVGSFNVDWRILVFYPEPEARDNIYWYQPIHVKAQNTFWLPWFISILICLRVQIRWYTLIGKRSFIFTFAENIAHNLCCQWKSQSHSPAHVLMRLLLLLSLFTNVIQHIGIHVYNK